MKIKLIITCYLFIILEYIEGFVIAQRKQFWAEEDIEYEDNKGIQVPPAKIIRNDEIICVGAILKPYWIVSLASCFTINTTYFAQINSESKIGIRYITQHPNYDSVRNVYNIAMVKLAEPIYEINVWEPVKVTSNSDHARDVRNCSIHGLTLNKADAEANATWQRIGIIRKNKTMTRLLFPFNKSDFRFFPGSFLTCHQDLIPSHIIYGLFNAIVSSLDGNTCAENNEIISAGCESGQYLITRFPVSWMEYQILGTVWTSFEDRGAMFQPCFIIAVSFIILTMNLH